VQRLKTQLDQYTDLGEEERQKIVALLPEDDLRSFRAQYLETAKRLQERRERGGADLPGMVEQLDFEFVLFDSALIDYDYIMKLIARFSEKGPKKQKMTREQIIGLLSSSARLLDGRDDMKEYIGTLEEGQGLSEKEIREGYEAFKTRKHAEAVERIAQKHGLAAEALQGFIDHIMDRYIFDPDALTDLFAPQGLGWKARARKELELMEDLTPLLRRLAGGREISGLEVYDA